jgi:AsmA family/AsmA-like C-terminal region
MTEDAQVWKRKRRWRWLALLATLALLAAVIVPPLVSVNRYKSRITQLMSESLGRPVRLSSVEMRLLPVPEFVLTDLTVEDDPAYGAEPVLRANTVTASIRLMSLWRGRLEIGTISLDEASLNIVRTPEGRWNLDPLFRTAANASPDAEGAATTRKRAVPLPYIEATNSRINFKRGAEKLPFSLVNTDLSFWQEQPGDWRIRLRGQPARTDVSLQLADTGVVRLEGHAHSAAQLRQLPIHLDMEWQEAQLGQLMRLVLGSDPGWRGNLTGELHVDGTADAAQIKTQLRAIGVHRAEFAPAAAMDFDASCGFLFHFSARAMEHLTCDSPLGDGRIHLAGDVPGNGVPPHLSVELDRIPVAAGLDALRTVRSDFGPGLEAAGLISGKVSYAVNAAVAPAVEKQMPAKHLRTKRGDKARAADVVEQGPLTGSLTVEGFQLSGDGLSTPIQASKLTLVPAMGTQHSSLATTVTIPAGGSTPLSVAARLALSGYQLTVHGPASLVRARELAHVVGMARVNALDALAGDAVTVDLNAAGPWLPTQSAPFANAPGAVAPARAASDKAEAVSATPVAPDAIGIPLTDTLSGTVTLHNVNWKADYLASHVEIAQATLSFGNGALRWDPVVFSYGPVKGTASVTLPAHCDAGAVCNPTFDVQFSDLDAATLQEAILGAHQPGTLLSSLLARLKPTDSSTAPAWPTLEGTVRAGSLILGPVMLTEATAKLHVDSTGAEITDLDADLLGGHVHGGGTLRTAADQGKPGYTLQGDFDKLNPARVGELLGLQWSGGMFKADGKIDLSGFTAKDLTASAKGSLHFDWRHGAVAASVKAAPSTFGRFDRWTADIDIANGLATLKQNEVQQGSRKHSVDAALTFGDPPSVHFAATKENQAKR